MHQPPILVLGGTGKTGRRVAARLQAAGHAVRVGSRAATPPFDWTDRSTWAAAVDGVAAAYIAHVPDLSFEGAADDVAAFAELAAHHGVRRLVLLSGRGEEHALAAERGVQESGAEWTVVRASWFFQNFSEDFLTDAIVDGELALPAGDVAEPFIDAADIAEIAADALTAPGHGGTVYEVTGPRLLTFADAVAEISAATGREIRYLSVPPEAFTEALSAEMPVHEAAAVTDLFATVLDGRNATTTEGVQRALGRPPADFRDWAVATAATGVWDPPAARATA